MSDEIENKSNEELSESELNDVAGGYGGGGGAGKVQMQDFHFSGNLMPTDQRLMGDGSVKPASDVQMQDIH